MDDPEHGAPSRFPFDPIYKALCCHVQTVRDLLRAYLTEPHGPLRHELLAALDLDTLRKVSIEWVTREFRLRRGDQVWQVDFTQGAQSRGYPRFLLVNLEFQSRRDAYMALRFLEQGGELLRELRAQGAIREGDPCPVLCVVLHNGSTRWTAAKSAAELVTLPAALGRSPSVPKEVSSFFPWGYWPIDFVAHRDRAHIPGNVMSMMIGIEFARKRTDFVAPLWETARNLRDDELRDTVARWLRRLSDHYKLQLPGMKELLAMQDVTVLTSRLDETIERWHREAVAEGRIEGHRAALSRLVARRFGDRTTDEVRATLEGVDVLEHLDSIAEWIIDAETADELRSRLASLLRG